MPIHRLITGRSSRWLRNKGEEGEQLKGEERPGWKGKGKNSVENRKKPGAHGGLQLCAISIAEHLKSTTTYYRKFKMVNYIT